MMNNGATQGRIEKLTSEQKRRKLEANRAKALAKKRHLLLDKAIVSSSQGRNYSSKVNDTSSSAGADKGTPSDRATNDDLKPSSRNAYENKSNFRKLIKKSDYIQYDFAVTRDTKGGYMVEKPLTGKEKTLDDWKQQVNEAKFVVDEPPPIDINAAPKCFECNSITINPEFYKVYGCRVCNKCKEKFPEKYSLLTKTDCKTDYFLTEPELMDDTVFKKIEKPNPHAKFSRMQLYLRYQVEEFAYKKWNGPDGLDAEWVRRQKLKVDKKAKQFELKLQEMKKRTRSEEYTRRLREKANDGYNHVHDWRELPTSKPNVVLKRCVDCGMETEEFVL